MKIWTKCWSIPDTTAYLQTPSHFLFSLIPTGVVPTPIFATRPNFLYVFTHIMRVIIGQKNCGFMSGLWSWLYWYFAFEYGIYRCFKGNMGLNYLQSPDINQQFFWPIMTLIICVQTYKKFGLVAKIGVGTFVCLIYIQNVNQKFKTQTSQKIQFY